MRHISNIGSAVRMRTKRFAQTAFIGVFSLSMTVTSGFTLLTPTMALAATSAPSNVQAITGGNSIAVVWDPSPGSIKNYEVYRNGTKVATVTPGQGTLYDDIKGNRYIDSSVTASTTYSYQVDAVGTDNSVSPLTTAVSATQPAVGSTTPVPTITLDMTAAPDLQTYMQTQIVPLLQTWYPKLSDKYAYPSYTPSSTITIKADTTITPSASTLGSVISINPTTARTYPGWYGSVMLHESTHVVQGFSSDPTGWLAESMADYTKYYVARDLAPVLPKPNDKLTDGYWSGAFFLNYLATTYDAAMVRKLNIAVHNGTYTTSYFQSLTGGKTDAQAWSDMRSNRFSAAAPIVGVGNKCITTQNGTPGAGVNAQISTCNGGVAQQWGLVFYDVPGHNTAAGIQINNSSLDTTGKYCLNVAGSATADGSQVWQEYCYDSGINDEKSWKTGANGSIIDNRSGKCLQPAGGATTDGTGLVISTCNGSTAQNWKLWTTNSAIDQRYASDQTFRTNLGYPTVAETTSGIYTYKGYSNGRAYNTTRSGVHEVSGAIWTQYNATGAHTAWGEPTTDEKPTPDGVGRFNEFYGAGTSGVVSIYWSPSSNAHVIHGLIRDRWGVTGWEAGLHGYPTSDEALTPNGLARFNNFQNGGIYWSSGTGAQSVWGAIYSRWGALGYENSFLGLPTTSELSTPDGVGRYNVFQSGSIYWSPSTGAWSVGGAIRDRWGQLGWETSYLGYPTSDEFSIAGGRRSNFQYGYITWNSSTGVVSDFHY